MSKSQLSLYESGKEKPRPRTMAKLSSVTDIPPHRLEQMRRHVQAIRALDMAPSTTVEAEWAKALAPEVGEVVEMAVAPHLAELAAVSREEEDRARAAEVFEELRNLPAEERLLKLEAFQEPWLWALCELACHESAEAAAHDPGQAQEFAEFAVHAAERVTGSEALQAQAYAAAFLGNARRVASHLPEAEEALARARTLWETGTATGPGPFDGSRLLDLEASLRRDQRQFEDTLVLLGQALARSRTRRTTARILLKRAFTLELMGDYEGALETLELTAPRVDAEGDPRSLTVLRFNQAVIFVRLARYREAEELLPDVERLVLGCGKALDEVRFRWLQGRVAAGLGRTAEAVSNFEKVRAGFASRKIPYDTALVSLDLGALYLEQGRTVEVKELARDMVRVFEEQEVHEEARKAVALFREAAERETATVELVRRLTSYLEKAQHDPALRFAA